MCYHDPDVPTAPTSHVIHAIDVIDAIDAINVIDVQPYPPVIWDDVEVPDGEGRRFMSHVDYSNIFTGPELLRAFHDDLVGTAVKIIKHDLIIFPEFFQAINKHDVAYIMQYAITFMIPDILREILESCDWSEYSGANCFFVIDGWSYYGRRLPTYDTTRLERDGRVSREIRTVEDYFICRNMDPYTLVQIIRMLFFAMSSRSIYPPGLMNTPFLAPLLEFKNASFPDDTYNTYNTYTRQAQKRFRDMFIHRLDRLYKYTQDVLMNQRPYGTSRELSKEEVQAYDMFNRCYVQSVIYAETLRRRSFL